MKERPKPFDRDLATELFNQLLEWRDETVPDDDGASAEQKNYKANQALFFGQRLFDDLLGWAFDHAVGVSLAGMPRGFQPIARHPGLSRIKAAPCRPA